MGRHGFSFNEDRPEAGTVQTVETRWAMQLLNALRARRKVQAKPNTKKWEWEFEQLRSIASDKDIQSVLDWYCNIQGCAIIAYSANSFRNKFFEIKEAMGAKAPQQELDPILQDIVDRLLAKHEWPTISKKELPNAVKRSYDNYKIFREKWTKLRSRLDKSCSARERRWWLLMDRYAMNFHGNILVFVYEWFADFNHEAKGWSKWSGRLTNYIFDTELEFTNKWAGTLVEAYTGSDEDWDTFKEILNAG